MKVYTIVKSVWFGVPGLGREASGRIFGSTRAQDGIGFSHGSLSFRVGRVRCRGPALVFTGFRERDELAEPSAIGGTLICAPETLDLAKPRLMFFVRADAADATHSRLIASSDEKVDPGSSPG